MYRKVTDELFLTDFSTYLPHSIQPAVFKYHQNTFNISALIHTEIIILLYLNL